MRIANNFPALSAFTSLNRTNKSLQKSINTLSTGLRLNSASDDAAGFAIADKMRSQLSGLDRAIQNSQDGVSLLQTAEGALGETNSMLLRMRELSLQACNDSLTSQDRQYLQLEIDELKKQIDKIAGTTQFNKKRILDGSSGALWSSSDLNVKAKINGGLTYVDQFGQKISSEGNYRIEVKAKPGQPQVQKSTIMKIPEVQPIRDTSFYDCEININTGTDTTTGATSGDGWNFDVTTGVLTITGSKKYSIVGDGTFTTNRVVVESGLNPQIKITDVCIEPPSGSAFQITGSNVKLFLDGENTLIGRGPEQAALEVRNSKDNKGPEGSVEINSIGGLGSEEGKLTTIGYGCGAGIGGSCHTPQENVGYSVGAITINGGTIIANAAGGAAIGGGGHFIDHPNEESGAHVRVTINGGNITAISGGGAGIGSGVAGPNDDTCVDYITINGGKIKATGGFGSAAIGGGNGANSGVIKINRKAELTLEGWVDTVNGATKPIGRGMNGVRTGRIYDHMEYTGTGGGRYPTIEDIPAFYNSEGVFLVSRPQTITIMQGDGKTAEVTLYAKDTIEDVRRKLNDAIAQDLGQGKYVQTDKFVSYVTEETKTEQGFETVPGTLVVRSAVPGKAGELYFSADEELLNAFGFNTLQESTENELTASVYNAHTGETIVSNVKATGSEFKSIIPPEIDIEVDPMTGLAASWDDNTRKFIFTGSEAYSAVIHLKDNGITFQTGANQGEDFMIQLGDTSCGALGISGINVLTRESANKALSVIDRAINKISSQRAKIGAYQNALEDTMTNLTTTSANVTSAVSRISDADMAQEMMNFVKLQILNQSGTSMLSQANQLPQSVMNLMQ